MSDGIKQVGLHESNVVNFDACFQWGRNDYGEFQRGAWKKGSYDYVIVDEAQDFSRDDIELLKSKARKALLVYGDTAQQLYKFLKDKQTVSMEDIQYFTKFPVEQLVFNHRLPKKIARVAQYLNSESDELEERCTEEGTEKPKILKYNTKQEQFVAIANLIKTKVWRTLVFSSVPKKRLTKHMTILQIRELKLKHNQTDIGMNWISLLTIQNL